MPLTVRPFLSALALLLVLSGPRVQSAAQRETGLLKMVPLVGNSPAVPDGRYYHLPGQSDSFRVDVFRCYLSDIQLLKGGRVVHEDPVRFHLLDLAEPSSLLLSLNNAPQLSFDAIRFTLGIDSATNAAGAGSGVLDPVMGMYWAWQSGYINLKLEGASPLCNTRKNRFQFHLGGFLNGHLCVQQVELPVAENGTITVFIALEKLLSAVDLRTEHTIMSPGAASVKLSGIAASMFTSDKQLQ